MKKKAFTLIELVVGITISMILMVSIGIFMSSGMKNIFIQQKVLENNTIFIDFVGYLNTTFNLIQSGSFSPKITASGIVFKRGQNYGEGGFSYIGNIKSSIINTNGIYCSSESENINTNHLIIKNFIPFEEEGENIFNNYATVLTGSTSTSTYISYQKKHVIKNNSGDIIIGKGIFGNNYIQGSSGKDIYLNSPTGLTMSGSNILFISDTLNNRILYYKINEDKIYTLLDGSDGLNEPTGLYYDNNSLYISNSGNGEILKYSSNKYNTLPTFTASGFSQSINNIDLSFFGNNTSILTNTGNWNIDSISYSPNYGTGTIDNLKYYFITKNAESIQYACSGTEIIFNNGKPSIYCTKAGSGQTTNYPNSTITKINISNLSGLNNTGSYYVNLKLFDGTTQKYSKIFPFFTQGDNNLFTTNDNTLEILYSGLNYPTGIWGSGSSNFNEFSRLDFSDKVLNYHKTDILLKIPIKSINITNIPNDLISLVLKYYKSYDCYNLDLKTERTFLLKKNLK